MFDICGWKIKSRQVHFVYIAQNHSHIVSVCTVKDILCPYTPQTKPPCSRENKMEETSERTTNNWDNESIIKIVCSLISLDQLID